MNSYFCSHRFSVFRDPVLVLYPEEGWEEVAPPGGGEPTASTQLPSGLSRRDSGGWRAWAACCSQGCGKKRQSNVRRVGEQEWFRWLGSLLWLRLWQNLCESWTGGGWQALAARAGGRKDETIVVAYNPLEVSSQPNKQYMYMRAGWCWKLDLI